jgi:uncharacterized membrane protein
VRICAALCAVSATQLCQAKNYFYICLTAGTIGATIMNVGAKQLLSTDFSQFILSIQINELRYA